MVDGNLRRAQVSERVAHPMPRGGGHRGPEEERALKASKVSAACDGEMGETLKPNRRAWRVGTSGPIRRMSGPLPGTLRLAPRKIGSPRAGRRNVSRCSAEPLVQLRKRKPDHYRPAMGTNERKLRCKKLVQQRVHFRRIQRIARLHSRLA